MDSLPFGDRDLMSPLSEERLGEVIGAFGQPGRRVLDVGCGKGAVLRRLALRHAIEGLGIDRSEALVLEARQRSLQLPLKGSVTFHVADLKLFRPPEIQDTVICMGASGALGAFPDALRTLGGWVRPGGLLLVDCGYWKQPPDPEYLTILGARADEHGDADLPARLGTAIGLELRAAWRSTVQEWDEFEDAYASSIERSVALRPDDPASAERARRIRAWRDAYVRWGRDTLGWGLYLFRKESALAL